MTVKVSSLGAGGSAPPVDPNWHDADGTHTLVTGDVGFHSDSAATITSDGSGSKVHGESGALISIDTGAQQVSAGSAGSVYASGPVHGLDSASEGTINIGPSVGNDSDGVHADSGGYFSVYGAYASWNHVDSSASIYGGGSGTDGNHASSYSTVYDWDNTFYNSGNSASSGGQIGSAYRSHVDSNGQVVFGENNHADSSARINMDPEHGDSSPYTYPKSCHVDSSGNIIGDSTSSHADSTALIRFANLSHAGSGGAINDGRVFNNLPFVLGYASAHSGGQAHASMTSATLNAIADQQGEIAEGIASPGNPLSSNPASPSTFRSQTSRFTLSGRTNSIFGTTNPTILTMDGAYPSIAAPGGYPALVPRLGSGIRGELVQEAAQVTVQVSAVEHGGSHSVAGFTLSGMFATTTNPQKQGLVLDYQTQYLTNSTTPTTISAPFKSAISTGTMISVFIANVGAGTTGAVTDSKGNTYTNDSGGIIWSTIVSTAITTSDTLHLAYTPPTQPRDNPGSVRIVGTTFTNVIAPSGQVNTAPYISASPSWNPGDLTIGWAWMYGNSYGQWQIEHFSGIHNQVFCFDYGLKPTLVIGAYMQNINSFTNWLIDYPATATLVGYTTSGTVTGPSLVTGQYPMRQVGSTHLIDSWTEGDLSGATATLSTDGYGINVTCTSPTSNPVNWTASMSMARTFDV